jgi:hypothetical protein
VIAVTKRTRLTQLSDGDLAAKRRGSACAVGNSSGLRNVQVFARPMESDDSARSSLRLLTSDGEDLHYPILERCVLKDPATLSRER